jgi:hypothetical protein
MKNWRNMPVHPTDSYAFWKRSQKDLEEARALYDRLLKAGAAEADLIALMDFVSSNARDDEAFSNAGEAQ